MISTTDNAVCAYGAEVLQKSLSAFRKEIPGVMRLRDIEYVHRLRVSSRRLNTALAMFQICYSAKRVKAWQKDIRQVTRILGKARDLDTQAEAVKTYLQTTATIEQYPGLRRMLLRVRQKRILVQEELLEMLNTLDHRQTLASLERRTNALQKKKDNSSHQEEETLIEYAGRMISPELDKFLSYDSFVDQVEAVEELHAMRIAAKKLRYTLECFSAVYPDHLDAYLSTMRAIQDQLGTIHDCDIWQSRSSSIIERERQRTEKYFGSDRAMKRLLPGFLGFFEDKRRQRVETYATFTVYWHELRQAGIWDRLRLWLNPSVDTTAVQ
jgi:CHAD domain-containing protein